MPKTWNLEMRCSQSKSIRSRAMRHIPCLDGSLRNVHVIKLDGSRCTKPYLLSLDWLSFHTGLLKSMVKQALFRDKLWLLTSLVPFRDSCCVALVCVRITRDISMWRNYQSWQHKSSWWRWTRLIMVSDERHVTSSDVRCFHLRKWTSCFLNASFSQM